MIANLPQVTLFWAGVLGLLMLFLAVRVIAQRRATATSLGDGGDQELLGRIRSFGNFTEYVPMIIILMALIEMSGGATAFVHLVGALLVSARLSHGLLLSGGVMSKTQRMGRMFGASTTLLLMLACSIYALILSA